MKFWKAFIISFSMIILLTGFYLYSSLNPNRYFQKSNIPILVTPSQSEEIHNLEKSFIPVLPQQEVFKKGSFNVLILGIDARKEEESRSDLMMLANINSSKKKVTIVSIPRDTLVEINSIGYTKINHVHLLKELEGGTQMGTQGALQAVSNLFKCPIHYYVKVNFEGFKHFVDTMGGVDIYLTKPLKLTYAQITLKAGEQHVDGDLALKIVRERYSLPEGDFGRQKNQFRVLKAIAFKLLEPRYLYQITAFYEKIKEDVIDTNFTDCDILSLVWMFKGLTKEDIAYIQLPGKEGYNLDPLVKKKLYYWIPDLEQVQTISQQYLQ